MQQKLRHIVSLLNDLIQELDGIEPAFPEEARRLLEAGVCLNCKKPLNGKKANRGCHESCYHRIWKNVASGLITERELIETGIWAPKATTGRKRITDDKLSDILESRPFDEEQLARSINKRSRPSKRKKQ